MTKKWKLLAIGMQLCYTGFSQTLPADTIRAKSEMQEVVVSGSKFGERNSKLAVTVKTIRTADLKRLNLSSAANLIETSGLAFVQKSQQGGGSPTLRGFEASRVLLMIDGVRMNNAIYRAGHLQNIVTIDPNILQRVEILYGPSSTLYGSDALGGVVNMFTRDPKLSATGKIGWSGNLNIRHSSAIDEKTVHADVNYAAKKWASLTSITYSDFGDVTSGKSRQSKYPAFGVVPLYAVRINGKDSALPNPNPNRMRPSGYNQLDLLQKFLFQTNDNTSHTVNLQVSHSSNIPRFDRLSELASGVPRFAEWYYGPQERYFASYKFEKKNVRGFFQEFRAIASYQFIEESRYDRRFKQSLRNERIEQINVAGITIDARRKMKQHEIVTGIDVQLNGLQSTARGFNVDNGSISKITTRYPDGENHMQYAAIYAQHTWKITDHLTLNDGLRINFVNLKSTFADTSLFSFPFASAKQQHAAVSGNAGLVFSPNDQFKIATVFSTGFRAPNFDDLAKLFDSRAGAVIVPNPDLKPEHTYNLELNLSRYFEINDDPFGASIGGTVFHTWFRNAIVTDAFKFNGQDSIVYTGVKSAVLASQNKAEAYSWGWNVFGTLHFTKALQLAGAYTFTKGRYKSNNTEVPLDHIPPAFGRIGLRYDKQKVGAEIYSLFNGWKRLKNYSPSGEDNLQYATADGMPSWYVLNARINYDVSKRFGVQAGVENIFDQHYRTFSSGISSAGRNFILSLKASL